VRLRLQGDGASWFRTSAWRGFPWPLTDDSRWRRRRGRRVGGGEACRRSRAPWLPGPWCRRGAVGQRRLPPGATLLDVDFSATAPGVPAGAVALHATRHRRLGTVALGSSFWLSTPAGWRVDGAHASFPSPFLPPPLPLLPSRRRVRGAKGERPQKRFGLLPGPHLGFCYVRRSQRPGIRVGQGCLLSLCLGGEGAGRGTQVRLVGGICQGQIRGFPG
jgi:hypothetical protein